MKTIIWLLIIAAFPTNASPPEPVKFCDLLRNPAQYNGKEVTVRASHRYGFEWSYLFCLDCPNLQGHVWLEFSDDLDDASRKALKRQPKDAGVVNITVRGKFFSGSTYGHLNGYKYEFVANSASDVAVVIKGMKSLSEEKSAEEQWACGGKNPK